MLFLVLSNNALLLLLCVADQFFSMIWTWSVQFWVVRVGLDSAGQFRKFLGCQKSHSWCVGLMLVLLLYLDQIYILSLKDSDKET